ncbi:unnamed protein product [Symbiodinium sp. CCMP2592]|nr:unnamed protein product [Symbiodinium sp. CCMP2592]
MDTSNSSWVDQAIAEMDAPDDAVPAQMDEVMAIDSSDEEMAEKEGVLPPPGQGSAMDTGSDVGMAGAAVLGGPYRDLPSFCSLPSVVSIDDLPGGASDTSPIKFNAGVEAARIAKELGIPPSEVCPYRRQASELANQLAAATLAAGVSEGSSGSAVDLQPRVLFAAADTEDRL